MIKSLTTCILLLACLTGFAQSGVDTLVMGPKKYLLKRTAIYHPSQPAPVNIPSEYAEVCDYQKEPLRIHYEHKSDSTDAVAMLDDGASVWVKRWNACHDTGIGSVGLYAFVDTIKLSYKAFSSFQPYIKSRREKAYFCASQVQYIYKGTLYEVEQNMLDGYVLNYWQSLSPPSPQELEQIKQSTFILRNLYYARKNETWYLDHQFIIMVK